MNKKRYSDIFLILLVTISILVPVLFTNLKSDQISAAENRKLAEPVSISEGYSVFMKSLDSCANDRIGFRNGMVRVYNEITVNYLHARNEQVIFGKDGWLFYREDLADYTGQNYTAETVEYCVQVLKALDQWCRSKGSRFVFMVGPNKSSVYHEYMPDYIHKADVSLLDALTVRLEEEGILFVNPKQALIKDSEEVELYYKLDTHWNSYGAKYALDELVNKLDLPLVNFSITEYRKNSGDMLSMLAVKSIGSDSLYATVEQNQDCIIETIPDTKDKIFHTPDSYSFICFRDSYTSALENYYTHYFDGPLYWNWNVLQTPEEYFPEYVIVECVERYIIEAINACAGVLESG